MANPNRFSLVDPAKYPFFYGYIILVIGSIGIWASMPGQTIGVSVFTDPVKDALGLSRNQFSNAYMIGTILSSLLIGRAGKWFDIYGARNVSFIAALGLGFSLMLCSWSEAMSHYIKIWIGSDTWMVPFVIMTGLFFLVRFSGQGVLTMASRNVIMIWFDKNRGKVNSLSSIAISFGFSTSPIWVNNLIEGHGWQRTWQILAMGLGVFALLAFQLYRNKPENHGLLPDGAQKMTEEETKKIRIGKQYTLEEAKDTRAFWMYALMLTFNSFFFTGLTFHVVSIFESSGFSKDVAIAIFLPASVVSVTVSTIFNILSDYLRLKIYLYLMIMGGVLASVGILFLTTAIGIPFLILGIGISGGFFAVLNAIVWPRFYGRKHLGAITGKVMSFLVLGSALAPSLFSLCYSTFSSYSFIGYLALAFLVFLMAGSIKANNPVT